MGEYKYGDKFSLKDVSLDMEVVGVLPQGQPLATSYSDDRLISIKIDGKQMYFKESVLDLIRSKQKEVIDNADESATAHGAHAGRRGRPPKNNAEQ